MAEPEPFCVRPVPGGRVRKPGGALLKEHGEALERDSFWQRRLDDGDVVLTTPAEIAKAEAAEARAAAKAEKGDQA